MITAIPVSAGELIDKITILEIKSKRVKDKRKLGNIRSELNILNLQMKSLLKENRINSAAIMKSKQMLSSINSKLWNIEDSIRRHEADKEFDNKFVTLARNIYKLNDSRSEMKHKINSLVDSFIRDEKQYDSYK